MQNKPAFEYNVFLSYSSKDKPFAEKLSKRIRRYIPPKGAGLGKRKLSVFRDEERLTASPHLPDKLKEEIIASEWLALLCSPNSADSPWVNDEVKIFTEHRDRQHIIFIRVSGEITDCLPPALLDLDTHPLYIDLANVNRKKFRTQSLRLIAALYDIDFMYLLREDEARRRRIIARLVFSSITFVFLLLSAYLILSVPPMYWKNIEQPEEYWPNRVAPMLPIHEIAINKQNPSEVLYLGKNAEWPDADGPLYSIMPGEDPLNFDSLTSVFLKDKSGVTPIGNIDITVNDYSDEFKGKGNIKLWSVLDDNGSARYMRSTAYQGMDADGKTVNVAIPFSLVRESEHPFDIGRLVEKLVNENLVDNSCNIQATLSTVMGGSKTDLSYSFYSDELLLEGYTSKEDFYGSEFFILSNFKKQEYQVLGQPLEINRHDTSFWRKIQMSNDWVSNQETVVIGGPTLMGDQREKRELAEEVCLSIVGNENLGALENALSGLDLAWDEDLLHFSLLTTRSEFDKTQMLMVHGEQLNRHDVPTTTFIEWLVRFSSNSNWKNLELPSNNIKGLWALDTIGRSALLLTTDKGFFLTSNAGDSWESANFNETGFTNGTFVNTFVLRNNAVYALIDRGKSASDPPNPLFRLLKRTWWQRWRTGLIELLK